MWSSRDMLKDNNDQQLFVKVTLRELIVYIFFLAIINYVTFGQVGSFRFLKSILEDSDPIISENFQYTDMTNRMSTSFQSLFGSQMEVRNMRQFWDFVEGDLINGIYWDKLYNKGYRYGFVKSRLLKSKSGTRLSLDFRYKVDFTRL